MKRTLQAAAIVFALVFTVIPGFGQGSPPPPLPPPPGMGRTFFIYLGAGRGWDKPVAGAPYSAEAITEITQTLSDGNRIDRKETVLIYRDGAGRIRRDRTLSMIGPWSSSNKPPEIVTLYDPVAGVDYVLNSAKKIAYKRDLSNRAKGPEGGPGDVKYKIMGKRSSARKVSTESLGVEMINGIEANGTRRTIVIPAGEVGNEKPITVVSESWYSPELQVYVMTQRQDPRFGNTTYQLTNIKQGEPPASLFRVPADYTVEEGPPRMKFHKP